MFSLSTIGGVAVLAASLALVSDGRAALSDYDSVHPSPGATYVSPENNLLLRPAPPYEAADLLPEILEVVGTESGAHTGMRWLVDGGKTLLFRPDEPFELNETVTVTVGTSDSSESGGPFPALEFSFRVSPQMNPLPGGIQVAPLTWLDTVAEPIERRVDGPGSRGGTGPDTCRCLPKGLLPVTLDSIDDPGPGALFLAPFSIGGNESNLLVLDDAGQPIFVRHLDGDLAFDFKPQPDGKLTYFSRNRAKFYALDRTYAVVDSFAAGNGYVTDLHELQILPNGNALLMIYDRQIVRMDTVVAGGKADAVVTGLVLQELNPARQVVFQWRSWDHMSFTDVTAPSESLTDTVIDYVHGNSIELDTDGNWLVSSRHINEVTKIDRVTGDILWRLGLNAVQNDFTFIGDTRGFSHQHDARRLANGNLSVFDNGVFLDPQYSRVVEYELDEENLTATQVYEYRHAPDVFGGFMGNAQLRADGSATIGWGGVLEQPSVTELHPDGSIALEVTLPPQVFTYRALRGTWQPARLTTNPSSLDFGTVPVGGSAELVLTLENPLPEEIEITCMVASDPSLTLLDTLPIGVPPGLGRQISVQYAPTAGGPMEARLYFREVKSNRLVASRVTVQGNGTVISQAGTASHDRNAPRAVLRLFTPTPNPAMDEATLRFILPEAGVIRLDVYDVRGRRVANVAAGHREAGEHRIRWRIPDGVSGILFARLHQNGRTTIEKFVSTR